MTVRIIGEWCHRCLAAPARVEGLCVNCVRFLAAFGSPRPSGRPWVGAEDPAFERHLREWLKGD